MNNNNIFSNKFPFELYLPILRYNENQSIDSKKIKILFQAKNVLFNLWHIQVLRTSQTEETAFNNMSSFLNKRHHWAFITFFVMISRKLFWKRKSWEMQLSNLIYDSFILLLYSIMNESLIFSWQFCYFWKKSNYQSLPFEWIEYSLTLLVGKDNLLFGIPEEKTVNGGDWQ